MYADFREQSLTFIDKRKERVKVYILTGHVYEEQSAKSQFNLIWSSTWGFVLFLKGTGKQDYAKWHL